MASRKSLVWLAVTAGVLLGAVISIKPASREYLRSHHSTTLSALIALLVPPDDLYAPVVRKSIPYGSVEKIDITHAYAGGHMVIGRLSSAPNEKITGHLDCGVFSTPLQNQGKVTDREGAATDLAHYLINGALAGRALKCEIVLKRDGREGAETIEVAKVSDL